MDLVGKRHILTKKTAPYVFISPFFILFAIFMVYPIIYSVVLSFHDVKQLSQLNFIGLGNYKLLFDTPRFYRALYSTTYYAAGMCLLNVILGFLIGLMLTWKHVPGTSFYRASGDLLRGEEDDAVGGRDRVEGSEGWAGADDLDEVSHLVADGGVLLAGGVQLRDRLEDAPCEGDRIGRRHARVAAA